MRDTEHVPQATAMAEAALRNGDLAEAEVECAPKVLELVLQACRGRVDHCVGHYIALALDRCASPRAMRWNPTYHGGFPSKADSTGQAVSSLFCCVCINSSCAVPLCLLSLCKPGRLSGDHVVLAWECCANSRSRANLFACRKTLLWLPT